MALAAFLPLRRGIISTKLAYLIRESREERKEQHLLSAPPYPDHLPGHTDEGNCGQIRVGQIRKFIEQVEGTMRKPPAMDKDDEGRASLTENVNDSTFQNSGQLAKINQESQALQLRTLKSRTETIKAQGSSKRFVWALFLSSVISLLI